MARTALSVLAVAFLASSCVIRLDGLSFDDDDFDAKHEETLELSAWHARGLRIDTSFGDVTLEPTTGPSRVVAMVHEEELGDGRLVYRDGVLTTVSETGRDSTLGDVTVFVNGSLPHLEVSTGMGDIEARGLRVEGEGVLGSGMGDVELTDFETTGSLELGSGMGDLRLSGVTCADLSVGSGMGSLVCTDVTSGDGDLESGMGDIVLKHCRFDDLEVETGLGDIALTETTYQRRQLSTGLGSVKD